MSKLASLEVVLRLSIAIGCFHLYVPPILQYSPSFRPYQLCSLRCCRKKIGNQRMKSSTFPVVWNCLPCLERVPCFHFRSVSPSRLGEFRSVFCPIASLFCSYGFKRAFRQRPSLVVLLRVTRRKDHKLNHQSSVCIPD